MLLRLNFNLANANVLQCESLLVTDIFYHKLIIALGSCLLLCRAYIKLQEYFFVFGLIWNQKYKICTQVTENFLLWYKLNCILKFNAFCL